jgi:hypothetical protein
MTDKIGIVENNTEEQPDNKPTLELAVANDKGKWGEGFRGGKENINLKGRSKNVEKKSNKELRMSAMLQLTRMLRPHLGKAVMTAAKIVDNSESTDQNKLKAAAFLVGLYKDVLKECYDYRYDNDEGEKIQEDNTPVFSLKVINQD